VKHREEVMEILEAFDLTRSLRDAGELAGCSPNTVALWVARRDAGELTATVARRPQLIDEFVGNLEAWMDASHGKVRADVAHDKLVAMGYLGSERTTRRAVAAARRAWDAGHRRVHRPWVPEPGLWFLCGVPHRSHSRENCSSIWFGTTTAGFEAEPKRRSSIAAITMVAVLPAPTAWARSARPSVRMRATASR
jgi:hypothetical protein